jgi:hypothetical protein
MYSYKKGQTLFRAQTTSNTTLPSTLLQISTQAEPMHQSRNAHRGIPKKMQILSETAEIILVGLSRRKS